MERSENIEVGKSSQHEIVNNFSWIEKITGGATRENNEKILIIYVFSTENWKKTKSEINYLFNLLENFLVNKIEELDKQNIKLKIIGLKNFSTKLNKLLKLSEKKTKKKFNK